MFNPRNSPAATLTVAIFLCSSLVCGAPVVSARVELKSRLTHNVKFTHRQQATTTAQELKERGIEAYKRGDAKGAIKTLQAAVKLNKDDPDTWYYLGRSLAAINRHEDARKAFENCVRLRPDFTDARAALAYMLLLERKEFDAEREAQFVLNIDERNAEAHYVLGELRLFANSTRTALVEAEKALAVSPDFALALHLKGRIVRAIVLSEYPNATREQIVALVTMCKETVASIDAFLKQNSNPANPETFQEVLNVLRPYADGNFEGFAYRPTEVSAKAKIISKPGPNDTGARGVVVLQMVLRRDGKVDRIRVISTPDDETAKMCIEAARKIKFIPAMKDGRAVSQYIRVEYYFE